jgi:RNA polymerase sigma factor (TIGR02999 family)
MKDEVTSILSAIERGDPRAAERLLPLVYDELRRLAARRLAQEKPGQTLQPTALVHEAYLRLVGSGAPAHWDGCGHFFAAAAEAMRRILVEQARSKQCLKRGGGRRREPADLDALLAGGPAQDVLALHEALEQLAAHDPVKAKLVEMRFFAGLTLDQAAECLGVAPRTADRAWRYARAWLYTAMAGPDSGEK